MYSASPQGAAASAAPTPRSAPVPLSVNVKCRLIGKETTTAHATGKLFKRGNSSCEICKDDNGGRYRCTGQA